MSHHISLSKLLTLDSQKHANEIAKKVQVEYTDVQKPVTDLREAIEKKLFHPTRFPCIKTGDTQGTCAFIASFSLHNLPHDSISKFLIT